MNPRPFVLGLLPAIVAAGGSSLMGCGSHCATDTDCGGGQMCGFAQADGCSAKGVCLTPTGDTCDLEIPACACDGTLVNIGACTLPSGFFSKPVAPTQACMAAPRCESDADCWSDSAPPPCNMTTHTCGG